MKTLMLILLMSHSFGVDIIDYSKGKIKSSDFSGVSETAKKYFAALHDKDFATALKFVTPRQREYFESSFKIVIIKMPDEYDIAANFIDGLIALSVINTSYGGHSEFLDGKWYMFSPEYDQKVKK